MDDPRDTLDIGEAAASSVLKRVRYQLRLSDYLYAGLVVGAIALAAYCWPLRGASATAAVVLLCALGYLLFAGQRAYSLLVELRRLQDVFETLRLAQWDGLPLDDVFESILQLQLSPLQQSIMVAPTHPTTRAVLKVFRERNPTVSLRDTKGEELPEMRPHVLYRAATKRVLHRFKSDGGAYVVLFLVRGRLR